MAVEDWIYDPKTGKFKPDPKSPTVQALPEWAQGPAVPAPEPKPPADPTKPYVVSEAEVLRQILEAQSNQKVAAMKQQDNFHADEVALAREKLAAEISESAAARGESAAGRAAALAESAADRALRERLGMAQLGESAADRASREALAREQMSLQRELATQDLQLQRELAELEAALRKRAMLLEAAEATGFIPASLAAELGIEAGPTLQAQTVAWARFKDAMEWASNPRDIVSLLRLEYGLNPEGQSIPFLQSLALRRGLETPNISANMEAIGQTARESTAKQLEAIPPMFPETSPMTTIPTAAVTPFAPAATQPWVPQAAPTTYPRAQWPTTQPAPVATNALSGQMQDYMDILRKLPEGVSLRPQFSFGGI